MILVDEELNTM